MLWLEEVQRFPGPKAKVARIWATVHEGQRGEQASAPSRGSHLTRVAGVVRDPRALKKPENTPVWKWPGAVRASEKSKSQSDSVASALTHWARGPFFFILLAPLLPECWD